MPTHLIEQDKLLGVLRTHIPEHLFDIWVKNTEFKSDSDSHYVLEVPSAIYRKRLAEFIPKISDTLSELAGAAVKVDIRVNRSMSAGPVAEEETGPQEETPANLEFSFTGSNLNHKYTFERFVVGKSNNFAHAT